MLPAKTIDLQLFSSFITNIYLMNILILFLIKILLELILTSDVELYFQKNAQQDRKRSHDDN